MLKKAFKEFNKFAANYDIKNPKIKYKYDHSLRVMNMSGKIAQSLNLNNEDVNLAKIIGLLHDVGRFEQAKRFDSFLDHETVDHGDLGAEMLFKERLINKFIDARKYDTIIKKAIINHNKFKIEENLSEKEKLHSLIIRDADKLDILNAVTKGYLNYLKKEKTELDNKISDKVYKSFINKKTILNEYKKTDLDNQISRISLIFDINFKYSMQIIKTNNYIEKLIGQIDNNDSKINTIKEITRNYINSKL